MAESICSAADWCSNFPSLNCCVLQLITITAEICIALDDGASQAEKGKVKIQYIVQS